jgi:3-(3-hydroxy-phenyl)propionate hydroxylase
MAIDCAIMLIVPVAASESVRRQSRLRHEEETLNPQFKPYPFEAKRYPASLPALKGGVDPRRRPAVVVGGGPVGYCAALGIANYGVPVVLLEADDSVCFGSRTICISRRSLEIVERLGAIEGFLNVGLPWTGGRSFYRNTEVLHFKMPADENQRSSAASWPTAASSVGSKSR